MSAAAPSVTGYDVAATVRDARLAAGLSVRELAVRAGTSRSAVGEIEAGRREPDAGLLLRLLDACGHGLAVIRTPATPSQPR